MRQAKILAVSSFVVALIAGCSSMSGAPPNSAGLYGDQPVKQSIPGSNAEYMGTRTFDYGFADVFEASKTALFRMGYRIDEKDSKKGKITASGMYSPAYCGALVVSSTVALYIKQVSPAPETRLTILSDRHTSQCWASGEMYVANDVLGQIQKVLSTY